MMTLPMPSIIITDTSCIIALGKINKLNLLTQLYNSVYTTSKVAQEYGEKLPDFFIIEDAKNKDLINILYKEKFLDLGESSAIALAKEKQDSVLIIDEYKGRKVAKALGIKVTGTLGIPAKAKRAGLIKEIKSSIDELEKVNFRISAEIIKQVLSECGEI